MSKTDLVNYTELMNKTDLSNKRAPNTKEIIFRETIGVQRIAEAVSFRSEEHTSELQSH